MTASSTPGARTRRVVALVRLAWRRARHERGRTVLVVALVAVPVAVAVVVGGAVTVSQGDPGLEALARMGQADVEVQTWSDDGRDAVSEALDAAAADGLVEGRATTQTTFLSTEGELGAAVLAMDPDQPLAEGLAVLVDGRWPGTGEVAVSPAFAERTAVAVGDRVVLSADTDPVEVVGLASPPDRLNTHLVVVTPDTLDQVLPPVSVRDESVLTHWLVSTPDPDGLAERFWTVDDGDAVPAEVPADLADVLGGADLDGELVRNLGEDDVEALVAALADRSDDEVVTLAEDLAWGSTFEVTTRADLETGHSWRSASEHPAVFSSVVSAGLLAEVALVAGAAYATGIRRRLREVGLVAAQGADRRQVRRLVVGEATLAGLLGSMLGLGLGVTLLVGGAGVLEEVVGRPVVGLPLDVATAAAPVVAGILAAVVAAWLPARTAASVPTLTALQGRMPVRPPAGWVAPAGIVLAAVGLALLGASRDAMTPGDAWRGGAGVVVLVAGVAMLAGPLVSLLGRVADRLRAMPRLVVRDAARQRTRAAAAVAATMVVLAAPVAAVVALGHVEARQALDGLASDDTTLVLQAYAPVDGPVDLSASARDAVHRAVDGSVVVPLRSYDAWAGPVEGDADVRARGDVVLVETGRLARQVQVGAGTPGLLAALGIADDVTSDRPVLLGTTDRVRSVQLAGRVVEVDEVRAVVSGQMPRLLVDDDTAADLALAPGPEWAVLALDEPITSAEFERVDLALREAMPGADAYPEWVAAGGITPRQGLLAGLAAALVVVLVVVAVVTALSAAESRHDLRLMAAVGAEPSLRGRFLGGQVVLQVGLGAVLAVPLGWLFAQVLLASRTFSEEVSLFATFDHAWVELPWSIPVAGILLPVVLGSATALVVRSSPPRPPRRIT